MNSEARTKLRAPATGMTVLAHLLAFGSIGWANPAAAAEEASDNGVEEITVTARKRDEGILEVPLTLTALSDETLELRGVQDRRDLNRFTPGFKAAPQNTSSATRLINTYQMRGLGTVNMFWNGVPIGGGDVPEMLDLQRVEVLKGPQNAYFGRSTFSGAINFIPKLADFKTEGYAEFGAATYGNIDAKAALQGGLVDGVLAGRAAIDYHRNGGQYDNYGYGGKLGKQETIAGSASLLFTPTDSLSVRVYGAYWEENDGPSAIAYLQPTDYNCNGGAAPAGTNNFFCGGVDTAPANRISQLTDYPDSVYDSLKELASGATVSPGFVKKKNGLHRQGIISQFQADYELPANLTASLVLGYNQNKAGQIFDYGSQFYTDPATFNPSITTYRFEDEYAEFRVSSDSEKPFRFLVGTSYVDSKQYIQSVLSRSGEMSISFPPTSLYSETFGIFGSASLDLFDKLFTVTVEGRYQEDTVGRKTLSTGSDLSGVTNSFVPRAILQWHVKPDLEVFASYSEGSSPGSLNSGFLSLPLYAQEQLLQNYKVPEVVPEQKLENYELGVKGSFFNNTLRVMASVYKAKWTKQPMGAALFYTTTGGVMTQANVTLGTGATDAWGTEWEVVWAPIRGLNLAGTFAYNSTEVVSAVCATCARITGNINPAGNQTGRFPEYTASLAANYRHPIFSDYDITYHIDANYQGREYADTTNLVWLEPYVMSNARLGLDNGRYNFEVYVVNLFDNKTPQSIAQTTEQITGMPTITLTPAYKRTFGFRAGIKF